MALGLNFGRLASETDPDVARMIGKIQPSHRHPIESGDKLLAVYVGDTPLNEPRGPRANAARGCPRRTRLACKRQRSGTSAPTRSA